MSGLRKLGWRWAATAVVLAAIVVGSTRISLFQINQAQFDNKIASASSAGPIQQTFVSNFPGLNEVMLQLAEPIPPDSQPVTLRLIEESPHPQDRLELSGPLGQFRAAGELRFTFEPLDDSAGRHYDMVIGTAGAAPLLLHAHHLNAYPAGALDSGGDLMFAVRYNGFIVPSMLALLPRLTENKPGLFGQAWLYVLLALAYVLVMLAALYHLAAAPRIDSAQGSSPAPNDGREN